MKRVLIYLSLLLSFNFTLANSTISGESNLAGSGTIKGKIESKADKKPIEYASIMVYSLPDSLLITGTLTLPDGTFRIEKLSKGNYYLVAYFMGFQKKMISTLKIDTKTQVVDCGTITLEGINITLEDVDIVEQKNFVEYKLDKKVISASQKMDAKGGSVVNLLENTPSIQIDIEGNVLLRGSENFTVLVDGKPTSLSGNDVLKQIPANTVENVEIITNPSAKYDPAGTSGIINIIMKKNFQKSTSALINGSIGTFHNYSGDFNLNHRTSKINLFLNGNGAHNGSYPYNTMESTFILGDSSRHTSQTESRSQKVTPYSFKAGLDWYINPNSTLFLEYNWGFWGMNLYIPTYTTETFSTETPSNYSITDSKLEIGGFYHNASIVHDLKIDTSGQNLKTSFVVATWNGENITDVNDFITKEDFETVTDGIHHISKRDDQTKAYQLKLDYSLPINKSSMLEVGYQGNLRDVYSGYSIKFQDFDTQQWEDLPYNHHKMKYSQNIQAIYATFNTHWKSFEFLFGLRGEYYGRNLTILDNDIKYPISVYNLFPTIHISKQFKKNYQLQVSYSRRVNRPREWNLYPFPVYSDRYISQVGNPNLMPEITDSYEINLMKQLKKGFVSLECFYRQTNNAFSRNMNLDSNGVILVIVENLDKVFAYGSELSTNLRFTKWYNLYASVSLYSYNVSQIAGNQIVNNRSYNSDFALNNTFRLPKNFKIQLVGFYNAPKATSQGEIAEMYGVNISVGKEFFNQKLSINMTARDIFRTANFKIVTDTPQLKSTFYMKNNYPILVLNITYKFNNYKRGVAAEPENEPVFEGGTGI